MATFNEILQYTMFAQAGNGRSFQTIGVKPFDAPKQPSGHVTDFNARFMPVWHFAHDADTTPDVVRDITCISRGMGNGRMGVCDEIRFQDVKVVTTKGKTIDLPLTPSFVIQKGYLKSGEITAGRHFLYPLAAEIDQSLVTTFGYEFINGPDAAPVKIPEAVLDQPSFMPAPGSEALPTVGEGQLLTLTVAPLRIIVCISVTTAKERADFEPGGLLGAGRIWPHVMVMANRELAETHATVHVKRPAKMKMEGGDHTTHAAMNAAIEAALYADNNREVLMADIPFVRDILLKLHPPLLGNPSPYWDDLFDAYEVGVTSGSVRAVDPIERGGAIAGAVEQLDAGGTVYAPRTIERIARQGAYDNVHVAPTMKSSAKPTEPPDHQLKKIYMAPFCEHDCLHTHWRWAKWHKIKAVHGWAARGGDGRILGAPYAVAGNPMVPANQFVDVESTGASSFKYIARAVGRDPSEPNAPIPAGTFSVFFHHGMAYALNLDAIQMPALDATVDALAIFNGEPDLGELAAQHTSVRYWRLRWAGDDQLFSPNIVNERLRMIDRAKVRGRT